jgi:two-component sensor histidine kinase
MEIPIPANPPIAVMVVDEDLRVEQVTHLAMRFAKQDTIDLLALSLPEPLNCVNALADDHGCGNDPTCSQCALRQAVLDSLKANVRHEGVEIWLVSRTPADQNKRHCFWVSTAPLFSEPSRRAVICAQDVTAFKVTENELKKSVDELHLALTEKTVMLREVHHRVKNDLAVISSLLSLQAQSIDGDAARRALEDSQRRVASIALIHEHLSGSGRFDRINFAEYVQQLMQALHKTFAGETQRVAIRVDADPLLLEGKLAVPAALISNELVTNAFKHAFPGGRGGTIHVTIREPEQGLVELAVEDDGVGSQNVLAEGTERSLGLQIVRILAAQLRGTLRQEPSSGTRVALRFPLGDAGNAAS